MSQLSIRVLDSDEEIDGAFPLMRQLRERICADRFREEVRIQQREGYLLLGGWDDSGQLACLAGIRVTSTLARGRHVFVDDLITSAGARSKGFGTQMLRWVARFATQRDVERIYLDSRDTAAGFYNQVGFTFLTSIPCWIAPQRLLAELPV